MKLLKKILLMNWLYFSKQVIELGDINFLTEKTGAGKSTIIDALQIVLLGESNEENFNKAANDHSERTLDGYLRTDLEDVFTLLRGFYAYLSVKSCDFQQFRKNQEQGVFPADTKSTVFFGNRALRNFRRN